MCRHRLSPVIWPILIATALFLICLAVREAHAAGPINVTTTADEFGENPNACSVREAVESANTNTDFGGCVRGGTAPYTIVLSDKTYFLTRAGAGEDNNATGDLDVRTNLTIQGVVSNTTVINATAIDRALHISGTVTVNIERLTVTGGHLTINNTLTGGGGGILSRSATLNITDAIVKDNQVSGANNSGGGIAAFGSGAVAPVTLNRVEIRANRLNGGEHGGGGLFGDNVSLVMTDTQVSGNRADGVSSDGGGGGISVMNSHIVAKGCSISDNTTDGSGGGIFQGGQSSNMTLMLNNCHVDGNQANSLGAGLLYGGGGVASLASSFTAIGCSFNRNSTYGSGGGIFHYDLKPGGTVVIVDSSISGNTAEPNSTPLGGGGGGILSNGNLSLTRSIIRGNRVAGSPCRGGGGVMLGGALTATDSMIINNEAILAGLESVQGVGGGGGILVTNGAVVLSGSTISGNRLSLPYNYNPGPGEPELGGGGIMAYAASLNVINCTVSDNTAAGSNGGVLYGGGILGWGITLKLNLTTIAGNTADHGGGVACLGGSTFQFKGAIIGGNAFNPGGSGPDCSGGFSSYGYNLVENIGACPITEAANAGTNVLGQPPRLAALADNGGPTLTRALLADSPAIDAGVCTDISGAAVLTDQRKVSRPQPAGGACDIGAFEVILADTAISKSGPQTATAGQSIVYTLDIMNYGPLPAGNVVVTDVLPAGLTYLASTGACDVSALPVISCPQGTMPAGEGRQIGIAVQIPADAVAARANGIITLTNQATITASTTEPSTGNNTASLATFVQDEADLAIYKFSQPAASVQAGQMFTYTVMVENLGPSYARGVKTEDDILASGDFTLVSIQDDPARNDACASSYNPADGRYWIACTLSEALETDQGGAGPTGRWTVRIAVRANRSGEVTNLARVLTGPIPGLYDNGTPDPNVANNRATTFLSVEEVADLAVVKSDEPDPVYAGGVLTYTLTVVNHGPSPAENVIVRDDLPAEVRVTAVSRSSMAAMLSAGPVEREVIEDIVSLSGVSLAGTASCSAGAPGDPSRPTTCRFTRLEAGQTATMTVVVLVRPDVMPDWASTLVIHNDASVSSDTFDPNPENNLYVEETEVWGAATLRISKTADVTVTLPGEYFHYTTLITNTGPTQALNVQVRDLFIHDGDKVTLVDSDVTGGAGSCRAVNFGLPEVRCNIGDLAPSQARRIALRMYANSNAVCGYAITSTLQTDPLANPTLSIDPTSEITATVVGPPCQNCYLPVVGRNW